MLIQPLDNEKKLGALYLVATPIGNLEDMTLRGLRVLREADIILAEDTRRTRKLMSAYDIHRPVRAYHRHSKSSVAQFILREMAESGRRYALVTDAGMPGLSDPGEELLLAAVRQGTEVQVIPGVSAVTASAVLSGMSGSGFAFRGFLPQSPKMRRRVWEELESANLPIVLFESPHRMGQFLKESAAHLQPEREMVICRELTKVHEEVLRGSVETLAREAGRAFKGELTIVLAPSSQKDVAKVDEDELQEAIVSGINLGKPTSKLAADLAKTIGLPRKQLYSRILAARAKAGKHS